jgi:TolA-binding protein
MLFLVILEFLMFTITFSLKNPRDFTRFKSHDLFKQDKQESLANSIMENLAERLNLHGDIKVEIGVHHHAKAKDDIALNLKFSQIKFHEDITHLPEFIEQALLLMGYGISPEQIPTSVPLPAEEEQQYVEKCAALTLMDLNLLELLQVSKIELAQETSDTVNDVVIPGVKDAQIDMNSNYVNEKQKTFEALDIPSSWLPDEFFCTISTEMMDYPIRLNDDKLIDNASLMTHWLRSKTNPFTNLEISESQIHYDWFLEERIDNFLKNATRIKAQKGALEKDDVARALDQSSALYDYSRKTSVKTSAELSLTLAKRYIKNNHYMGAEQLLMQGLSQLDEKKYRLCAKLHFHLHAIYLKQKNPKVIEENFTNALQSLDTQSISAIDGLIDLGEKFYLESNYVKADRCYKKAASNLNRMLDDKVGKAPLSEITALDKTLKQVNLRRKATLEMLPVKPAITIQRFWRSQLTKTQKTENKTPQNSLQI